MVLLGMLHQSLEVECLKKEENKLPKINSIRTGHENMSIIKEANKLMRSYYKLYHKKIALFFHGGKSESITGIGWFLNWASK